MLLEDLHKRGMALPEVGPSLRAGDGMLFAWHTEPVAPWQDERWLAEMRRSLRPSAFAAHDPERVRVAGEQVRRSERVGCLRAAFAGAGAAGQIAWPIWVGVDASTKRDSTALVAVTFDRKTKCVRLIAHKVFTPTPGDPIDFEATIEKTLREWHARFRLRQVLFDPYQMAAVAQRLARERMPIEEYPQTVPNLTAATSNLFDLISGAAVGAVSRRWHAAGDLARDHRREFARLASRQDEAAAQDRRGRCAVDGVPRGGA